MASKFPRAKPYKLKVVEIKALVRHRDGYRCTECGMTARQHQRTYGRALEAHRVVPGSKYTVKGCRTLCRGCHYAQHGKVEWGLGKDYETVTMRSDLVQMLKEIWSSLSPRPLFGPFLDSFFRPVIMEHYEALLEKFRSETATQERDKK